MEKMRYPIISIIGHIDHGKTSLLDNLTKSKSKEEGNITQKIHARTFSHKNQKMTFLDTPGHEIFSYPRECSVKYSDIILLIVSIEDGIKAQTVECINLANKYSVPIIVVITKIDKVKDPSLKTIAIMKEFSKYNIVPEEWGGDTFFSIVSSTKNKGINDLIDKIIILFEIIYVDKKDNSTKGFILDSFKNKQSGIETVLILLNGQVSKGDYIYNNNCFGKVTNINGEGKNLSYIKSGLPFTVRGLSGYIKVGETFLKANNLNEFKKIKKSFSKKKNIKVFDYNMEVFDFKPKKPEINIIIKSDTEMSLSVIKQSIDKLSNKSINIIINKSEIGELTKSDLDLAKVTKSIVLCFNSNFNKKYLINYKDIIIKQFKLIHELLYFLKEVISNKEQLLLNDSLLGILEVKKIFKIDIQIIAGCKVIKGKVMQNSKAVVFRKDSKIIESLNYTIRVYKNIVKEVSQNNECGFSIINFNSFQIGDVIKFYKINK